MPTVEKLNLMRTPFARIPTARRHATPFAFARWPRLVLAVALGWSLPAVQPVQAVELNSAEQVRRLNSGESAKSLPVRIRGVVTFFDSGLYSRFIQDATAGIYFSELTNLPALQAGQEIEIEGATSPGEYAPIIVPTRVQVLGEGTYPVARPVAAPELLSGSQDSQLVEISGIVRSVRFEEESQYFLLEMMSGGARFTAYTKMLPVAEPGALVDSTVKVRGVCSTLFNRLRQLFGFRILVSRPGDVVIEKPAPPDPYQSEAQTINSLLRFTPQGTYGHRVKVTGTVSSQEAGRAVFIEDHTEGLLLQTRQRTPLQPGDVIEVLGFPAQGEYTPMLQDAIYRKTADGKPPVPVELATDEILKGAHDCRLVRLKANLVERTRRGREQFLVLESGGYTFPAYFSQDADVTGLNRMLNGSELSVTGICLIERGSGWQAGEGWRAKAFRLLLPSLQSVVVTAEPAWWTQPDKLRVAGITGLVALSLLLLIDILRRRPGRLKEP